MKTVVFAAFLFQSVFLYLFVSSLGLFLLFLMKMRYMIYNATYPHSHSDPFTSLQFFPSNNYKWASLHFYHLITYEYTLFLGYLYYMWFCHGSRCSKRYISRSALVFFCIWYECLKLRVTRLTFNVLGHLAPRPLDPRCTMICPLTPLSNDSAREEQ